MSETTEKLLAELALLRRRMDAIDEREVKRERFLGDLLYNLDTENMPAIKTLIDRYQSETGVSIAAVQSSVDDCAAEIVSLAGRQDEDHTTLAAVSATAGVADAKASLFASVEGGTAQPNGAAVVAAVNGAGSSVKISADHINLDGVTAFARTDELAAGTTTVDGACISAHSLDLGALARDSGGQIHFPDLGSISFTDPDTGAYGSLLLSSNEFGDSQLIMDASEISLAGAVDMNSATVNGVRVLTEDDLASCADSDSLTTLAGRVDRAIERLTACENRVETVENILNPPV